MRSWILALTCATAMMTNSAAQAAVEGQTFDVSVMSTVSGRFTGVLDFLAQGVWTLDVDDSSEGGIGDYTQSGAFMTMITATGDNGDDYVGSFTAVATDPKQLPGLLGAIARRNNMPATISGSGFGNAGDLFRFSGTEILP
ncbi:MAG: hypothetical protein SH850_30340 [Planctomycetaceae bacterium]|nr:hypothetical protein [Planctomycetaceae bacterium]